MLNMHWVSHPTLFCEQTTQGLDKVIIAADVIQGMIKYVLILLSCDDQKLTSGPPTSSYTNDFKHTYFHPPIMNFGCLNSFALYIQALYFKPIPELFGGGVGGK